MKFFAVLALIALVQVSKAQDITPSNVLLRVLNDINTGKAGFLVAPLVDLITNDLINLELYQGVANPNAAASFKDALFAEVSFATFSQAPPPATAPSTASNASAPPPAAAPSTASNASAPPPLGG